MRHGHPGNYACKRSATGMHHWRVSLGKLGRQIVDASAVCQQCGLTVTGSDAAELLEGADSGPADPSRG